VAFSRPEISGVVLLFVDLDIIQQVLVDFFVDLNKIQQKSDQIFVDLDIISTKIFLI